MGSLETNFKFSLFPPRTRRQHNEIPPEPIRHGRLRHPNHLGNWWSQAESNRRPLECHSSALPTELWPRIFDFAARTLCRPALRRNNKFSVFAIAVFVLGVFQRFRNIRIVVDVGVFAVVGQKIFIAVVAKIDIVIDLQRVVIVVVHEEPFVF